MAENTDTVDKTLENSINNEPEKPSDFIISSFETDNIITVYRTEQAN